MVRRSLIAAMLCGLCAVHVACQSSPELAAAPEDGALTPPPTVSSAAPRVSVAEVQGGAERQAVSSTSWIQLRSGDTLAADEFIRTVDGGRATLEVGSGTRVALGSGARLSVREASGAGARLRLESGRLSASIPETGGTPLSIESAGSDAIAEATGGDFSMLSSGTGQVTVATQRGRVKLTANGTVVDVGPGEQARVHPGQPLEPPSAIPPSLFLKVVGSRSGVQRARTRTVEGRSSPGALIRVNGVRAVGEADGHFTATVPLEEGKNRIVVEAEDALGRTQRADAGTVTVRTGSGVDGKTTWEDNTKAKGRVVW